MLPSIRFVWPSCCDCFERTGVGAYRIRPPWRGSCMFDGGDVFVASMSNHPVQASCHPWNDRKCVGAYRIRPPWRGKCTSNDDVMLGNIISFPLIWGRMRYAPTHVPLWSRLNTVYNYPCSMDFWADNIMTKPPKRLRRCWLGSHKTLKTVATTLTRVTQNRRNGCDDGIVFTFFNECSRDG